ncbi:MAG TPA: quinone-dependent dihydroorotate dehydrogenase, partial [Candidatus Woesebacteria bacterium]|nr:quinone-dependent dihydroorotate dehydrogenase [Candidatus Woesebacteria bacterium]
ELNISCPNTFGGEPYTTCPRLESLMDAIDKIKLSKPLYVKMPIDQSEAETKELLSVLNKHNVQGVIFGNLTKDRSNPLVTEADRLEWKKLKGNLSGKPTWERSNSLISLTKKHYKNRFTIVGTGGIFTAEDAQHKLDLGADLLQLITGMIFGGPQTVGTINLGLALKISSPSD